MSYKVLIDMSALNDYQADTLMQRIITNTPDVAWAKCPQSDQNVHRPINQPFGGAISQIGTSNFVRMEVVKDKDAEVRAIMAMSPMLVEDLTTPNFEVNHATKGTKYHIVCVANLHADKPGWPVIVSYKEEGDDAPVWACTLHEFLSKMLMKPSR